MKDTKEIAEWAALAISETEAAVGEKIKIKWNMTWNNDKLSLWANFEPR
jgi:hypothetical protein